MCGIGTVGGGQGGPGIRALVLEEGVERSADDLRHGDSFGLGESVDPPPLFLGEVDLGPRRRHTSQHTACEQAVQWPHAASWEDDLDTPRDGDQLVRALETTWDVVDSCLDRRTPEMLDGRFIREYGGNRQVHRRGSVLQRLFSHDAYHCGELSQTLGILGLPQIDLWRAD